MSIGKVISNIAGGALFAATLYAFAFAITVVG